MRSKLDRQGELLIDHTFSPGITPEWAASVGATGPVVGAGQKYESGLLNCKHCSADVITHPQRTRERAWCWTCDAYICDNCGLLRKLGGYVHRTARQEMEEIFNRYQRSF